MRIWTAAAADVAAIGLFAAIGRSSHAESLDPAGVVQTAWPFVVGWALGFLISRGWRRPAALGTGLVIWVCTVAGGMLLRVLSGNTAQLPFIIVATLTIALLLLGWRGVAALIGRRAPRPEPIHPVP